ncbi:hypothetical protein PMAYCL1PPCAC_31446, partial [Pristionchus mayeri]
LPSQSSIFPSHFRDGRGAIYISSLSSLLHLLFTPLHKSENTTDLHIFFILSIFHLPLISLHTFDGGVAHARLLNSFPHPTSITVQRAASQLFRPPCPNTFFFSRPHGHL